MLHNCQRKLTLLLAVWFSICRNNPTVNASSCTGGGSNIYCGYLPESDCKKLSGCSWRTVTESDCYGGYCSYYDTKTCGGTAWCEDQTSKSQCNAHYSCDWGGGGGDGEISWGGLAACFVAIIAFVALWIWWMRRGCPTSWEDLCQSPADNYEEQQRVDDNKDPSSSSIVEPTSFMNLHDDDNEDEENPPSPSPPIVAAMVVDDVRTRPSPPTPPTVVIKTSPAPPTMVIKTTIRPDGSKKVVKETMNPDGRKTISTTITYPNTTNHHNHHHEQQLQPEEESPRKEVDHNHDNGVGIIPQRDDVCFGKDDHPGTKRWKDMVAQSIMDDYVEVDFDQTVFKALKKKSKGYRFLVYQDGVWLEATRKECFKHFGTCFDEEQKKF